MKKLNVLFCIAYAILAGKGYFPANMKLIREFFPHKSMKQVSDTIRNFHSRLVVHKDTTNAVHYQSKSGNEFIYDGKKWYAIYNGKAFPVAKKYWNAASFLATGKC